VQGVIIPISIAHRREGGGLPKKLGRSNPTFLCGERCIVMLTIQRQSLNTTQVEEGDSPRPPVTGEREARRLGFRN